MYESIIRKLNKMLESKNKIKKSIKKINKNLTDDIPLREYHNYFIEQKQKEEQYQKAIEFYRIRTDNGKNFHSFLDIIENDASSRKGIARSLMCNTILDIRGIASLRDHIDLSELDTSEVTKFDNFVRNTILTIGSWDLSKVEDMSYAFYFCKLYTKEQVYLNTINVKNMEYAFCGVPFDSDYLNVTFDTSNVTNMEGMFSRCDFRFSDLNFLDLSSVENMDYMFRNATGSLNVSSLDINHCDSITGLFQSVIFDFLYIHNWNITNNTTLINTFDYSRIKTIRMDYCNANTLKILIDELINAKPSNWGVTIPEVYCKYDELIQVYSNPDDLTNITFIYV
jgi:hypothetical protein